MILRASVKKITLREFRGQSALGMPLLNNVLKYGRCKELLT